MISSSSSHCLKMYSSGNPSFSRWGHAALLNIFALCSPTRLAPSAGTAQYWETSHNHGRQIPVRLPLEVQIFLRAATDGGCPDSRDLQCSFLCALRQIRGQKFENKIGTLLTIEEFMTSLRNSDVKSAAWSRQPYSLVSDSMQRFRAHSA